MASLIITFINVNFLSYLKLPPLGWCTSVHMADLKFAVTGAESSCIWGEGDRWPLKGDQPTGLIDNFSVGNLSAVRKYLPVLAFLKCCLSVTVSVHPVFGFVFETLG